MASKRKLILVPSPKMDSNKSSKRNENRLIRMSSAAREFMGFDDETVEVWATGETAEDRASSAVELTIFQAYKEDLHGLKEDVKRGDMKAADLLRVGFVTTQMWKRITGGKSEKNIWISSGVDDTLVGSDPEFLLFEGDKVIHAGSVMSKVGELGSDGAMAELRPKPGTSAEKVVEHIKSILSNKELTQRIAKYSWMAGCYHADERRDYPVGGHIHIGNPISVANMPWEKRELFFNILNKIVDELLSVPMTRLDGEIGSKRRTGCKMGHYGYFGEWRECSGRLEHRTLSGLWLSHPEIAKCVIGTAKAITDEAFKLWSANKFNKDFIVPKNVHSLSRDTCHRRGYDNWRNFPICQEMGAVAPSSEIIEILNESNPERISKAFLKQWHERMSNLSTYTANSKYILGLKEILSLPLSEIRSIDRSLKANWLEGKKLITQ